MKLIATAVAIGLYGAATTSLLGCPFANAMHDDDPRSINPHAAALLTTQIPAAVSKQDQLVKFTNNPDKHQSSHLRKFVFEPELDKGTYTYIVELKLDAVAQEPTAAKALFQAKFASKSSSAPDAVKQHLGKIAKQQQKFMQKAQVEVADLRSIATYQYALNGFALKLTQAQAMKLAEYPEVLSIKRQQVFKTETDRGPTLVGAPRVWIGDASPLLPQSQGEGIVIGIIDSGVNSDHPSFAEISGDGYVHTNPLGDGNYLGDCAGNFAELCNNKLIGVYSYPVITNDYADTDVFPPNLPRNGEDYNGHGSHVASTAAGNVLLNVAEVIPDFGEEESAGVPTGFIFPQISGVAPRANIISYQACYGGREDAGDTYGDCPSAAILASIESAIQDQVDVINFSVSGGGNPWNDPTERAFLNARNAGIFVATSAGNSGPNPETSVKNAPWYTSVAASEHGRQNAFNKELTNFSGGASTLSPISGQSNSGAISAPIVYAGDFTNSNDPSGDPAQCLQPFPAGTFSGQIVVCDRGEIARIEKAENVRDGGAAGYVLANVQGGETFLANDVYVVPGIHINADNGDRLKAWLASGTNHSATITAGVGGQSIDETRIDVLASFSSRGPNTSISTLSPTMTAPGVDIYAAYADQQFGHDGHTPAASDFDYLSGTSMSSPHVAGAAALLKAVHPTWDPDQIRSALSLTATTAVKRQDASTDADYFDMGAGRIQVDQAVASGLIMSESANNYTSANPSLNGDPRTLNLPSITDNSCAGTCTWSRTFTATTDATWTVVTQSLTNGLSVSASPTSFTLNQGQSQSVSFTIESAQAPKTEYSFATARLSSPGLPDANLPISVFASIGDIPTEIEFDSRRQIDSVLIRDIDAIDLDDFYLTAYKPVKATVVDDIINEDSDNADFLDDINDGVKLTTVTVPNGAIRLIAEIKSSTAPDLDLFVLRDNNNDGFPSSSEIIGQSTSSDSTEEVAIDFPTAGTYFIAVQSFTGSINQPDEYDMRFAVVRDELANDDLVAQAPNSIAQGTPFDLRIIQNLPESEEGDDYYAAIALGTAAGRDDLGKINLDINRLADDVAIDGTPTRIEAGEVASLKVIVAANPSSEARNYRIIVPLPVGTEFSNFTTSNQGQSLNNQLIWVVNKPAGTSTQTILDFDIRALDGVAPGPIEVIAQSQLINQSFSALESSAPFQKIQVEGPPVITFNGNATLALAVSELETITIPLNIAEPNGDEVTVLWTQTAGPAAAISQVNGVSSLTAPAVDVDTQLAYSVTVTDINNQSATASISVNVRNNAPPVIASVSAPASASGGQNVTITISASDPENQALTITVNGIAVNGTSTTVRTPTSGTSVTYNVAVSDGVNTVNETVTISLTQRVAPPASGGSGGGSLSLLWLLLLPIAVWRRQTKSHYR